jgi:hypothetical protein
VLAKYGAVKPLKYMDSEFFRQFSSLDVLRDRAFDLVSRRIVQQGSEVRE